MSDRTGSSARWLVLPVLFALAAGAWLWAQSPCPRSERAPQLLSRSEGHGPLEAGAGSQPFVLPYPVVRAGYAPPRTDASQARLNPRARAVVLRAGRARIGWVSLELMLVSGELTQEIRTAAATAIAAGIERRPNGPPLDAVLVSATHVHSSTGAYERNALLQLAGTGHYRQEVRDAVVAASVAALKEAAGRLEPATLAHGMLHLPDAVSSRSGGAVDDRLTRLELKSQSRGTPIAELLLFAAHPTLAPHPDEMLDPDYPARLSAIRERLWGGVSLFLPASVGNASAHSPDPHAPLPEAFAERLADAVGRVPTSPVPGPVSLRLSRAAFELPAPDLHRLLPRGISRLGEAVLCRLTPERSELASLSLGPIRWIALPAEPSGEAAHVLEVATGAQRVVAVTGDYLSYVETPARVKVEQGESRRQYFDSTLLQRMEEAARAVPFAVR